MSRALRDVRTLYEYRVLLWMWTVREIKIRYKQSVLGAAWAVLQPFALMVAFTLVFSSLVRVPTNGVPYPVFAYAALLPWTFLATSISFAVPSLVNNINIVTKIYFPREILPISSVIASAVDLLVATLLFALMMAVYGIPAHLTLLWVPALFVVQLGLILGMVLIASALNVWYRDIRFVVPLGIQLWMYATPIIYPIELVPERFRSVYALNPMAGIIDSYRRVVVSGQQPEPLYMGISVIAALGLLVLGYGYFKRSEGQFADVI